MTSLEAYYHHLAPNYDASMQAAGVRTYDVLGRVAARLCRRFELKNRGNALLDLSTGTGHTIATIAQHIPLVRAVGVDISQAMLDRLPANIEAVEHKLQKKLPVQTHHTSNETYLYKARRRRFHIATCISGLEFVANVEPTFAGVRRILYNGGFFIFNYVPVIAGHPIFSEPSSPFEHPITGDAITTYCQEPQQVADIASANGLEIIDQHLYCPKPEDPSIVAFIAAVQRIPTTK